MRQSGKSGEHRAEAIEQGYHHLGVPVGGEAEELNRFQGRRGLGRFYPRASEPSQTIRDTPTQTATRPR